MKKTIFFLFIITYFNFGQNNPGFETGDLSNWIDVGTGTESISTTNVRTGTYNLSYSTNNSTNQRMENDATFSVANNSYLHCIGWVVGSNADARASVAINNGSSWGSATIQTIGSTSTRLTHSRQNTSGSSTSFQVGLNSRKVTNATILYWDDVVAYVSTSASVDLTSPDPPTSVSTSSNGTGTTITVTWTDGNDGGTGSQEAIILRVNGLSQSPPTLSNQGRYSTTGGANGPNSVGTWTVVGIVNAGVQTFDDNTTSANTAYTYSVYMRDLAYNYSSGSADDLTSLPVELTSFTALVGGKSVELKWNTATEVNNYGFEIERREIEDVRSEKWEKIGFVQGYGNSNSPKDYSFSDLNPTIGSIYYRLKQIDFDGSYEYSNTLEVNIDIPLSFELNQNYPNPFNPNTVISYVIPNLGTTRKLFLQDVSLIIYDILGNEVATLVREKQSPGSYSYNFNAEGLASGTYIYKLTADDFVEMKKMILIK